MATENNTPNDDQDKSKLPDPFLFARSLNWAVIPCEGVYEAEKKKWKKRPIGKLVPHGVKNATRDPDLIATWLQKRPDAIPGVAAAQNRLVVLDADAPKGGLETLAKLETEGGTLPYTLTVRTPGTGKHVILSCGLTLTGGQEKLGPGLDVIAGERYFIGPFSHIEGYGDYTPLTPPDTPIAAAPEWVIDLIKGGMAPSSQFSSGTESRVSEAPSSSKVMEMMERLRALHTWKNPNIQLAGAHAAAAWPPNISHDPALTIGSFLYSVARLYSTGRWNDPDEISNYVGLIAQAVGKTHESLIDVQRAARAGWERAQRGGTNIRGYPALCRLLGKETARQFANLLGCKVGSGLSKDDDEHDWQLHVTTASSVSPRPVSWIWPGRLPLKKLVLCSGDTEVGKSMLICDVAARISRGLAAPLDDDWIMPKGDVLWFVTEDDPEETLVPRLIAAGADLDMVHIIDTLIDENGKRRGFDITKDLERLEELLERFPNAVLVIFDPLQEYLGLKVDSHNNAAIRGILGPFIEIATRYNVGYLGVSHIAKQRQGSVRTGSIGSIAFSAIARAAWFIDDETTVDEGATIRTGRKLMTIAKSNLAAPEDKETYAFSIQTRAVPVILNKGTENEFRSEIETAAVVWHEVMDISAQTVWSGDDKKQRGPKPEKLDAAVSWLLSVLFSHNDLVSGHPVYRERRSKEVDALREGAGISKATYERAKGRLEIRSVQREGDYWLTVDVLNARNTPPPM